ncbi:MAG: hypothetical protein ACFE9S_16545 [Candidatus Hermodarchaeota archaeon]
MITINDNYQNLEETSQIFQLRGFTISELKLGGDFDIIFQKGIGITLTMKIIDLYKNEILEKRQGYIKDNIGTLTIYINFFEKKQKSRLIFMYIDKTENLMNYTNLYHLSRSIYHNLCSGILEINLRQICNSKITIPKAQGLIGIFIIDKAGFLYFSKVNKDRPNIANNNFQIAGFISAILIYAQDFIAGEEYGLKLEDVNLGDYHLFLKTKKNVIFAYIIDEDKRSENIKRYMQLVVEEFLDTFYDSHVIGFKGDLSPFHDFERVIDQYFEI